MRLKQLKIKIRGRDFLRAIAEDVGVTHTQLSVVN